MRRLSPTRALEQTLPPSVGAGVDEVGGSSRARRRRSNEKLEEWILGSSAFERARRSASPTPRSRSAATVGRTEAALMEWRADVIWEEVKSARERSRARTIQQAGEDEGARRERARMEQQAAMVWKEVQSAHERSKARAIQQAGDDEERVRMQRQAAMVWNQVKSARGGSGARTIQEAGEDEGARRERARMEWQAAIVWKEVQSAHERSKARAIQQATPPGDPPQSLSSSSSASMRQKPQASSRPLRDGEHIIIAELRSRSQRSARAGAVAASTTRRLSRIEEAILGRRTHGSATSPGPSSRG